MSKPVLAYHFTDGYHLRDGQPLEMGREYVFDGEPEMCVRGYHASRNVFDALEYAPGATLSRVECREVTEECDDKIVCRRRRVIATIDATKILRRFARLCAFDVIHLWDAPEIVIRYLKTGDESIRDAARAAARDAANAAARPAEWNAAMAAARSIGPRSIGRDAAMAAARDAAMSAAMSAAWAAAWATAKDAARDAAMQGKRVRLARMVTQERGLQ